ncbi:hypothetical protein WMY93_001314 [Mugilogobius chulae]|uniref:Cadherin domain-containing protein n=1 Tax=Mugilogobius chulae TaxID=88201 RepID=A0AAW0Q1G3_9GOBI
MVLSCVQTCFIPPYLDLNVDYKLPEGTMVTLVEVAECDTKSLQFSCDDPDFTVEKDGALVTVTSVNVNPSGRTFSVVAKDNTGSSVMKVFLHQKPQRNENLLKRTKRRWSPPPFYVQENDDGFSQKKSTRLCLIPQLTMLSINKPVDRERNPQFVMTVNVYRVDTGVLADDPLDIYVNVDDKNDNALSFLHHCNSLSLNSATKAKDKHMVIVQLKDLDGAPGGLTTTGTATITLTDINDNPPTFKQPSPLDFEKTPNIKLEVVAQNKAPLQGSSSQWLTAPVDLTVTNVDEGPEFIPPIKYLTVKENTPNGTVIGTYTAIDPETKSSAGIRYYKGSDPASWISVNRDTGELKVANTIDRESSYVQNGVYNITVKAVDATSKSGMGTVVIQVEDENDNIPKLPTDVLVLCEKKGELGSVLLVAEDKDKSPYAEPFTFSIPPDSDDKWTLTKVNDTAATLQQAKELHLGLHEVKVLVTDLQGSGKVQTVSVRICQCVNGVCPAQKSSITLGSLGWLALLLPLLLLLLLFLLLIFLCVTTHEKMQLDDMTDSGGVLLKSNTEAPGEEVDSSLLTAPNVMVDSGVKGSLVNSGWIGNKSSSSMQENAIYKSNIVTTDTQYTTNFDEQFGMQYGSGNGYLLENGFDSRLFNQDSSLLHTWQTNGRYLDQKLYFMGAEDEGRYANDVVHAYGFEGVGSAAGSVGCCSNFGEESLDFLDTLGPKFKTLADVCSKR